MKNLKLNFVAFILLVIVKISVAQWSPVYIFPSCPLSIKTIEDKIFVCTAVNGIYVSTDLGVTFCETNLGLDDINTRDLIIKDSLLLLGTRTGVFRSTDYGNTWSRAGTGIPANIQSNVGELILRGDSVLVATWGNGIFLSLDFGMSWSPINNGIGNLYLDCIYECGGLLFAGSPIGGGIIESEDNGQTWVSRNRGVPKMYADTNKYVYISSFANIGDVIFASSHEAGILRSDDLGLSWNAIPTPNYWIWKTLTSDFTLLTGHDGTGIHKTEDLGLTWTALNEGLTIYTGEASIRSMCKIGDYIYIGTWSNIMYRRPINEIFTIIEPQSSKISYNLYPNPAKDEITIEGSVISNGLVSINVYDVQSRRLISGQFYNQNKITLDVSQLNTGIYFIEAQTKNNMIIKKVIIQ